MGVVSAERGDGVDHGGDAINFGDEFPEGLAAHIEEWHSDIGFEMLNAGSVYVGVALEGFDKCIAQLNDR